MMSEWFDDEAARGAWDEGADAWQQFVRSGADYYRTHVHGPALLEACRVKLGASVLDVGCGEGYFSRELAREGAEVTALDLSPKLLGYAREEEARAPLGIEYVEASATQLDRIFGASRFDLVASCMAVQDFSDPQPFFHGANVVLKPTGRLVFSVPHPASDMPVREWERDAEGRKVVLKVDRYFETGPTECHWNMERLAYPWRTPCWRRTLEEWTSMTAAAGFLVEQVHEPRPRPETVEASPALEDCTRMPYFLIVRLVKRN